MVISYEYKNVKIGLDIPNFNDPKSVDEFDLVNFSMSSVLHPNLANSDFNVFLPNQVHGDDIIVLKQNKIHYKSQIFDFDYSLSRTLEADAIVSFDKEVIIGVRTADCAPILFSDGILTGVIHAGWRGLKAGIIQKTINFIKDEVGFDSSSFVFFILPCIHVCCYEVGKEFLDWGEEFCHIKGDKIFFDIPKFVFSTLSNLGVLEDNIFYSPLCTSCYSNVLPSYRASKTEERMVSFISLA
ncbi:MAG: polyphenol oxidase family protein [Brevinematia bacterium]